ncbi:unnamed protein product [Xylocopa violacea]|uniref:Uncharacterized protein n=1 Tax=Xylocopa violacea TaxID=135666 RepID=A0ABP1P0S5_XYLVO
MKKNRVKQLSVSTSQHDLVAKPYGFCCDIKDQDTKLFGSPGVSVPPFPSSGPTGGGPNIKLRIQEEDDVPRYGYRFRSGQGIGRRGGQRSKYRGGLQDDWGDQMRGRRRGQRIGYRGIGSPIGVGRQVAIHPPSGDRMTCKRCKGPLRWYLEDEIEAARDIMIRERQEKYIAEMKKNIKIAKEKERRRRRRKKKMLNKHEETNIPQEEKHT